MPIKLLQNNDRVAQVQFFCDSCGKLVRTNMMPRSDLDTQNNKAIICWECKQSNSKKK